MELIDKAAVKAEIGKLQLCTMDEHMNFYSPEAQGEYNALCKLDSFINSLEVKEVDLEKEIQDHIKECLDVKFPTTDVELIKKDVAYTAKIFFELGLKAQKGE